MSAILRGKGYIAFEMNDDVHDPQVVAIDSEDIMVFESGVILFLDPGTGFQKVLPQMSYYDACITDVEYTALASPAEEKPECPRCHGDPQSLPLGRCPKGCRA